MSFQLPNQDTKSFRLTIAPDITVLEHPIFMGARLPVQTKQLAQEFFKDTISNVGNLPVGVRFISYNGKDVIVERPPQKVKIWLDGNPHLLSLPWLVFVLLRSKNPVEIYLYAKHSTIYTDEDVLYTLPLPLVDKDNHAIFSGKGKLTKDSDIAPIIESFLFDAKRKLVDFSKCPSLTSDDDPLEYLAAWSQLEIHEVLELTYEPAVAWWDSDVQNLTVGTVMTHMNESNSKEFLESNTPFLSYIRSLALDSINQEPDEEEISEKVSPIVDSFVFAEGSEDFDDEDSPFEEDDDDGPFDEEEFFEPAEIFEDDGT